MKQFKSQYFLHTWITCAIVFLAFAFLILFAATGATHMWMLILGFLLMPISIVYARIFRRCPNCCKYIPSRPVVLQCPQCGKSFRN